MCMFTIIITMNIAIDTITDYRYYHYDYHHCYYYCYSCSLREVVTTSNYSPRGPRGLQQARAGQSI